MHKTIINI